MKKIECPKINPTFFYGPILSYKFHGGISLDKGKYRFRFSLTFKSGDVYSTQKSGYCTPREAERGKELLIAALERKEYVPFEYTVKEFFDYWLYHHMIVEKEIVYNTYQTYRNVLYNHLLPALKGNRKLLQITIEDLEQALRKIEFPSVKDSAAKLTLQIFSFALEHNYISFNPSIAAVEHIKKELPKRKPRKVAPFTIEQIKLLLYVCRREFPDMYFPLLFSLTLGSRISETIALKYSDIDFSAETIYIQIQLGRDINDDGEEDLMTQPIKTKSKHGERGVPAPRWILDEIIVKRAWYEKQKQRNPDFRDLGYLCCHYDGKPFHRSNFGEDFHKLLSMCGLRQIVWHDLRHTYGTVLKNNSVNMKAISEFLGHYSPKFTEKVYIYQDDEIYDCSILSEVWESCRPIEESKEDVEELFIPFSDEDYHCLLA